MQIKKYQSRTLKEGKLKVYNELGDDAIILSTRTIKPSDPNEVELVEIVETVELVEVMIFSGMLAGH